MYTLSTLAVVEQALTTEQSYAVSTNTLAGGDKDNNNTNTVTMSNWQQIIEDSNPVSSSAHEVKHFQKKESARDKVSVNSSPVNLPISPASPPPPRLHATAYNVQPAEVMCVLI
jgi:hypothetical protein